MSDIYEGVTKSLDQATGKSSLYWGWFDKGESHSKSIPYRTWQVTASTVTETLPPRYPSGGRKTHRNAYGERVTEAQEQQLERRLTKLCQMDW